MADNTNKHQERLLETFRYLCNNDSCQKQLTQQDVQEVRSMLKQIQTPLNVNFDPESEDAKPLPTFTERLRAKDEQEHETDEDDKKSEEDDGDDEDDASVDRQSTASRRSDRSAQSDRSGRSDGVRRRRPETYEQRKLKQNYLVILRKLEKDGYEPTQKFTMDDSLQDIK